MKSRVAFGVVALLAIVFLGQGIADAKKKKKKKPKTHQKEVASASPEVKVSRAALVYDGPATNHTSGSDPDLVVLNAVGDIAYPNGWGGIDVVDAKGAHLFDPVRSWLDTGDLNFANIECPLTYVQPKVKKTYPIACDPKRLNYVLDAGFNLFSLANNHALDAGTDGLVDTLANFRSADRTDRPIFFAGTGASADEARAPVIFTVPGKNTRVAMFALSASGAGPVAGYQRDLPDKIAAIRGQVDIVLVSVHAGPEYHHEASNSQAVMYRAWVDAGADVVLGHHPHVVQGVEHYKQGLILYSMGNFSFGSKTKRQKETGARMYSMIARMTFRKGKLVDARVVPLWASNTEAMKVDGESLAPSHCSPQVLRASFAAFALAELQDFTDTVPGVDEGSTKIAVVDDTGVIDLGLTPEEIGALDSPTTVQGKPRLPRVVW